MIDNLALGTNTTISAEDTNIQGDAGVDFVEKWNSLSSNGEPVQSTATHGNGVCTSASSVAIANGSGVLTCNGASYADNNDGFIAYSDPSRSGASGYNNCLAGSGVNADSLTKCGLLYNWYTATAGSGSYQIQYPPAANVASSICPAGWNLPKGDAVSSQNEFAILDQAMYDGNLTSSYPKYPAGWQPTGTWQGAFSGRFYTGSFYMIGGSGLYWSSSASSYANASYEFYFNSSGIVPSIRDRSSGFAVRCLL